MAENQKSAARQVCTTRHSLWPERHTTWLILIKSYKNDLYLLAININHFYKIYKSFAGDPFFSFFFSTTLNWLFLRKENATLWHKNKICIFFCKLTSRRMCFSSPNCPLKQQWTPPQYDYFETFPWLWNNTYHNKSVNRLSLEGVCECLLVGGGFNARPLKQHHAVSLPQKCFKIEWIQNSFKIMVSIYWLVARRVTPCYWHSAPGWPGTGL